MSRLQVMTSADGQSETQKLELAVHTKDDEQEETVRHYSIDPSVGRYDVSEASCIEG